MKSQLKAKGFTIVELLTVMGIIVVLISLLLPALSMVRDFSNEIQQKAQFHSIEVGIGMYEHDFGTLPPSNDNYDAQLGEGVVGPTGTELAQPDSYPGAMKLAEAMVGLDMLGFHPNSGFYASGTNMVRYTNASTGALENQELDIYTAEDTMEQADWQTAQENLEARKGPYIDLENANVNSISAVYGTGHGFDSPTYFTDPDASPVVLCDVFSKRRQGGETTGTPVLYFKARTQFSRQDRTHAHSDTDTLNDEEDDIYNVVDNYSILDLGVAGETSVDHPVLTNSAGAGAQYGVSEFERMILNDKVTSIKRPYRASSYILWSAGKDGLYGTADDIFNFDSIKE